MYPKDKLHWKCLIIHVWNYFIFKEISKCHLQKLNGYGNFCKIVFAVQKFRNWFHFDFWTNMHDWTVAVGHVSTCMTLNSKVFWQYLIIFWEFSAHCKFFPHRRISNIARKLLVIHLEIFPTLTVQLCILAQKLKYNQFLNPLSLQYYVAKIAIHI